MLLWLTSRVTFERPAVDGWFLTSLTPVGFECASCVLLTVSWTLLARLEADGELELAE